MPPRSMMRHGCSGRHSIRPAQSSSHIDLAPISAPTPNRNDAGIADSSANLNVMPDWLLLTLLLLAGYLILVRWILPRFGVPN